MSTKIYTGTRVHLSTCAELFAFLQEFRAKAEAEFNRAGMDLLANSLASHLDRVAVGLCEQDECPLSTVFFKLLERWKKMLANRHRDPAIDLQCEIALGFHDGMIYAIPLAEHRPYLDIWQKMKGVEPYPYWNNTERPDDMSSEEWGRRASEWNAVFPGPLIESGLTFTLVNDYAFPPRFEFEKIEPFIPDFDTRLTQAAMNVAIHAAIRDAREKYPDDTTPLSKAYFKARDNAEEIARIKDSIRSRLAPVITKEMALGTKPTAGTT